MTPPEPPVWSVPANIRTLIKDNRGIVLDLRTGKLFALDSTAADLWKAVEEHDRRVTLAQLVDSVGLRSRDRAHVEDRVRQMLLLMEEKGLVSKTAAQNSKQLPEPGPPTEPNCWEHPVESRNVSNAPIRGWWVKRCTVYAFLGLSVIELIMRTLGFAGLFHAVQKWPVRAPRVSKPSIPELCLAINKAARWFPVGRRCLQTAAITVSLLRWYGVPAEFVIGCRIFPFEGHAWGEVCESPINEYEDVKSKYEVIARC